MPITINMGALAASLGINNTPVSKYTAPDEAMRRLALPGQRARTFVDLVQLSGSALQSAVREIDTEGQKLEAAHLNGAAALEALQKTGGKLTEIRDLQRGNAKGGSSPITRRDNQKKIDALLKEIDQALGQAGQDDTRVFDGQTKLSGAGQTLELPELSMEKLGRVAVNSQMRSIADLKSRAPLDTTRQRSSTEIGASRSIDSAIKTVADLSEKVRDFTVQTVRPRLGDVAEVLAGLYESLGVDKIRTFSEAQSTLRELRNLTLQTTAVASAVGADGWDQERVIELLS